MDNGHEKIPWGWSKAIYKKYTKEATTTNHISRGMVTWKLALKGRMWTQVPFKFFPLWIFLKRTMKHKKVFWKDVMLFIIKGFLPWGLLNQFGCIGWRINHVHKWSFHPWIFLWVKRLSTVVQKTLVDHVQLTLTTCLFVTCTFDL